MLLIARIVCGAATRRHIPGGDWRSSPMRCRWASGRWGLRAGAGDRHRRQPAGLGFCGRGGRSVRLARGVPSGSDCAAWRPFAASGGEPAAAGAGAAGVSSILRRSRRATWRSSPIRAPSSASWRCSWKAWRCSGCFPFVALLLLAAGESVQSLHRRAGDCRVLTRRRCLHSLAITPL